MNTEFTFTPPCEPVYSTSVLGHGARREYLLTYAARRARARGRPARARATPLQLQQLSARTRRSLILCRRSPGPAAPMPRPPLADARLASAIAIPHTSRLATRHAPAARQRRPAAASRRVHRLRVASLVRARPRVSSLLAPRRRPSLAACRGSLRAPLEPSPPSPLRPPRAQAPAGRTTPSAQLVAAREARPIIVPLGGFLRREPHPLDRVPLGRGRRRRRHPRRRRAAAAATPNVRRSPLADQVKVGDKLVSLTVDGGVPTPCDNLSGKEIVAALTASAESAGRVLTLAKPAAFSVAARPPRGVSRRARRD